MSARSIRRSHEREEERQGRRLLRRAGIAVGATAAAAAVAAPGAQAVNYPVTNLNNAGAGSLRQAALTANATAGIADTITFSGAGASGEIRLTTGDIPISDDLTITGPGAGQLSVSGDADNDNVRDFATSAVLLGDSRIFNISDATSPGSPVQNVSISGLTLREGVADSFAGTLQAEDGGAIYSRDTALTIANVNLTDNVATDRGGAIYQRAASAGRLAVSGSQISNNRARASAGGISSEPVKYGPGDPTVGTTIANSQITNNRAGGSDFGGLASTSPSAGGINLKYGMAITDTTISGNTATTGTNGMGGGAILGGYGTVARTVISGNSAAGGAGGAVIGGLRLLQSTVSGNTSGDLAGGLLTVPLGSKYAPGPTRIDDSTVSGNTVTNTGMNQGYGAGVVTYALGSSESLVVRSSTISANTAEKAGAGIFSLTLSSEPGISVRLKSSIVADNVGGGAASDLRGARPGGGGLVAADNIFAAGFSLVEAPGTAVFEGDPGGSNAIGVDPKLSPLAANGGPTQTQALALTSPAIDSGNAYSLATDQRGLTRPIDSVATNAPLSDGTDIGAFEVQDAAATGGDPDTVFDKKPKKKLKLKGKKPAKVKLLFSGANNSGAPGALTFECKIDKVEFVTCTSPLKLKLAKGKHTVEVRAIDSVGRVDSTPAKAKIKVVKKKPKKTK